VRETKIFRVTEVALIDSMRLTDSNHGSLMTNPEREMGRTAKNPEAASASDEEVQEDD